jgi:ATP-dependent Zn protease
MRKRLHPPRSGKRTAIHEAGHAVIGRVLGMTCGPATIVPDTNGAGHSITRDPWLTYGEWEARGKYRGDQIGSIMLGRVLTMMAGAEAERVLIGRCRGGDGQDRYDIACIVDSSDFKFSVDAFWDRIEPRLRVYTRALVRRHRAAIERVAAALQERGTLSSEEIADRMKPDTGNAPGCQAEPRSTDLRSKGRY